MDVVQFSLYFLLQVNERFDGTLVSIIGLNTPSNAQVVEPGSTLGCVSEVNAREWRITGMMRRVSDRTWRAFEFEGAV